MSVAPITFVDARHTCPAFPIPPMVDAEGEADHWAKPGPRGLPTGICFHVTAVAGGFGVSKALLAKHDGDEDAARLWRYTAQRHVRTYHWITDHRGRRVIRKLPAEVYSFASNGLNRTTIAHAYDSGSEGPFDWDLAIAGIVRCVEDERADGVPLAYGYAHRQSSDQRGRDPGEEYWRRAVRPAAEFCGLELLEDYKIGSGKPIAASWREPWIEVQS